MTFPTYFETKNSLNLFGLYDNLNFLINLYKEKKLPQILMLSGKKGCGKSTLINHLMFFIFDQQNYNLDTYEFNSSSIFYNHFKDNIYPNIIYLSGCEFKNTKIEDIRNLKTKIFQTSILNNLRFIILDDVDLFNNNSLNALLKIIEEPTKNNHFILINNQSRSLIETIKSRCLDIKVILNEKKRQDIILSLIKKFKINLIIDPEFSQLTPGHFIKFNHVYNDNNISPNDDFLKNLSILLNLYKKDKDIMFIDMISFLTDNYFNTLKKKNLFTNERIIEYKRFVLENINKFFHYNLNQNALLNTINNKINNE